MGDSFIEATGQEVILTQFEISIERVVPKNMPLNSIMEHTYSQINFSPVDLPYHSTAVVASDSNAVFTPVAMPPQPIH